MVNSLPICVEMPSPAARPAGRDQSRFWPPGTALHVCFLDGTPILHERVAAIAREWSKYANFHFLFDNSPEAQIRVAFTQPNLWSYIGTDALLAPPNEATLGLGALDENTDDTVLRSVVLHVFGHVLGLVHEHQNPSSSIPWDRGRLYAYFAAAYALTKEQVDANILARYDVDSTSYAMFDARSIMVAPIPNELTVGRFMIGWNRSLSETDKSFAAQAYPLDVPFAPVSTTVNTGGGAHVQGSTLDLGIHQSLESMELVEAGADLPVPDDEQEASAKGVTPGGHIEEHIRLDVAHDPRVFKDEPFDFAVVVNQANAPLPTVIDELPVVASETGTVYRSGVDDVIRYRIEVTGTDCDVIPSNVTIELRPGESARPRHFIVTAHRAGLCMIVVTAYQNGEVSAAQKRVRINVEVRVQEQPPAPSAATEAKETNRMDIVLTPKEVMQFKEALLSAFDPGDLEQVVYYGLEVRLANIVSDGNFDQKVHDLVTWANANNKVEALLKQARDTNQGNVKLRDFDAYMKARPQPPVAPVDGGDPLRGQKGALLDELCKLSVTEGFTGRSSLLDGIPGTDSLNRDAGIKRLDLDLIVSQLAKRGRMANGQSPVAKLIDNALPYAQGYESEPKLRAIQQTLA